MAIIWGLQALALAAVVIGLRIDNPWLFLTFLASGVATVVGARWYGARTGHDATVREAFAAHPRATRVGMLVALVAFPAIFSLGFHNPHWIYVGTLAGIYVCLALGLNIVVGLAGLLDLGYVAFYAIGAYSSALISVNFPEYWWALWAWIPCSVALAAGMGMLLGAPTLRLRGDYLAIVTLGFGEIVRIVLNNWDSLTNGPKGLIVPPPRILDYSLNQGVPALNQWLGFNAWGKEVNYYLITVAYAILIAVVAKRLDNSRTGRAWRAIREDELAAQAMGIDTTRTKLLAFGIGASFAGVAGLLFAHMQGFIDPMSFIFMESAIILCMVVLGGMGSIPGVILGAIILAVLPEKLRTFSDYRMLVFGIALVGMMVLRPEGLLPPARALEAKAAQARS